MEWDTNPLPNPNHPIQFDGHGKNEDPITATYCIAPYPDDISNKSSYIGVKAASNGPPPFDVRNYTDPKTNKYSYWYHTTLDAQPPSGLVDPHVAKYYCLELEFLDDKPFANRTQTPCILMQHNSNILQPDQFR